MTALDIAVPMNVRPDKNSHLRNEAVTRRCFGSANGNDASHRRDIRPHAANGTGTRRAGQPPLTAFRFILVFGIVSALVDIVYEGARSVTGPFLGVLGASALLISVVTGAWEAVALVLRLVFGYLADRPRLRWALAISGYGLTALSVPLLGITNALWIACLLVLAERLGKAVRSPAKDAMIAEAGTAVGRGKAFAFHGALDQIGAIIGPLLVGASLSLSGSYGLGFVLLALPGIAAMLVLFWLRRRLPDTSVYEPAGEPPALPREPPAAGEAGTVLTPASAGLGMPRQFWMYAAFSSLTMFGYATFGLLSFHLVTNGLLAPAVVPVVYAAAMAVDALAALVSGWLYDRIGLKVLLALPFLATAIPWLGFSDDTAPAVAGVQLWGAQWASRKAPCAPPCRTCTGRPARQRLRHLHRLPWRRLADRDHPHRSPVRAINTGPRCRPDLNPGRRPGHSRSSPPPQGRTPEHIANGPSRTQMRLPAARYHSDPPAAAGVPESPPP